VTTHVTPSTRARLRRRPRRNVHEDRLRHIIYEFLVEDLAQRRLFLEARGELPQHPTIRWHDPRWWDRVIPFRFFVTRASTPKLRQELTGKKFTSLLRGMRADTRRYPKQADLALRTRLPESTIGRAEVMARCRAVVDAEVRVYDDVLQRWNDLACFKSKNPATVACALVALTRQNVHRLRARAARRVYPSTLPGDDFDFWQHVRQSPGDDLWGRLRAATQAAGIPPHVHDFEVVFGLALEGRIIRHFERRRAKAAAPSATTELLSKFRLQVSRSP
jgi:hypothetical protein